MEKVIDIELMRYLEHLTSLIRSRASTGDLLTYVYQIWSNTIENYEEYRTVVLDISEAFDQHRILNICSERGNIF